MPDNAVCPRVASTIENSDSDMHSIISFNVNGKPVSVENPDPETSLATYLRNTLCLPGTKLACGEGVCGSCTVVIGTWRDCKASYRAVNACVMPLFLADGCFVITVEGIGSPKKIHAIQDRMARGHATQCGFCSPGFVMSAYALLRVNKKPTRKQIDQAIKGNLCRCTGYRPIIESLYSFANEGCCGGKVNGVCCKSEAAPEKLVSFENFHELDESQDLIYPPSLREIRSVSEVLTIRGPRILLLAPTSVEEAVDLMKHHPGSRYVSTAMAMRLGRQDQSAVWISTHRISELKKIEVRDGNLFVGSSNSLADLVSAIETHCSVELSTNAKRLFDNYSSQQIMNLASWTGSICSWKAPSDLRTLATALSFKFQTSAGGLSLSLSEITGSSHLLEAIIVPTNISGRMWTWKAGKRFGPDTSIVSCASLIEGGTTITGGQIVFGILHENIIAKRLTAELEDRECSTLLSNIDVLWSALDKDLSPISKMEDFEYRKGLARAAVFKMACFLMGEEDLEERAFNSTQIYKRIPSSQEDAVGRPLAHIFSDRSTTGEAVFIDDIRLEDPAYLGFVLSTESHAEILSIDYSAALEMEGVLGHYDISNIPSNGTNRPGLLPFNVMTDDTPLFADGLVESRGQVIAVVAATSLDLARRAAKAVRVQYKIRPAILTIAEALAEKAYVGPPQTYGVEKEVMEEKLVNCQLVLEGEVRVGGQEHMYMEPQSAVAIPGEAGECTIWSSTQAATTVQTQTAAALGISANNIVVRMRRVGGAFGGKCSQSVFPGFAAALVARLLGRPVSCIYSREEDGLITGKRHPALVRYRVGINSEGRVEAAFLQTIIDAGYSVDNSEKVLYVAAAMSDVCYSIPVIRNEAFAVKTHKNTNTAFRGYGQPQAYMAMECIMQHIAHTVNKSLTKIKSINFNACGGVTMSGNPIRNDAMIECWEELKKFSQYEKRKEEVDRFNSSSPHIKRGIAMSAVRFGLTHATPFEQCSVLVQIYLDGSVGVSIGGAEMGQGLVTKCQQVASRALERPISSINMLEAGTDKTCNIPETGGSQGADIHGRAVQLACERLLSNLRPLMADGKEWKTVICEAYRKRIPMQVSEHMRVNRSEFGLPEGKSTYFTTGAACVEAEVDCMTGQHQLLSVDIVMDCGESLNPAIDIGQIEGGFMQGYGMLTCEDLQWDDKGELITKSMATYKIPTASMAPREFRVKLLGDTPSYPGQVYSSKGIGEPPLMLSTAAFSAIRSAIDSRRKDQGKDGWKQIDSPLTARDIMELCQ